MSQRLIPPRGKPVRLRDYDPGYTGGLSKEEGLAQIPALRARLNELQDTLYADRRFAVLVVLQGIDTAGKDGTIKSVFQDVGPLGCSVANFGVPTEEELAHDYLWRYHLKMPERGRFVVFNRSYYEAVLVERVKSLVPRETWQTRYAQINALEQFLVDQGTLIAKFFLHISRDEQRERLQERIDNPKKHWKFRAGDLEERRHWDQYQEAFEEMLSRCNQDDAPWHVVPANRKWYRDIVVARALVERLEGLGLRYPGPFEHLAGIKVD